MSYNRNKKKISEKPKANQQFSANQEGSLGLLALGDIGLDIWRKVKNDQNNSSHE